MTAAWILVCLIPLGCGLATLLCRTARSLGWVLAVGTTATAVLSAWVILGTPVASVLGGPDALGRLLLGIVDLVGLLSTVESLHYWRDELRSSNADLVMLGRGIRRVRMYFFWQQAFLASLLTAAASGNLGLSWVAIELTTITSAVLVGSSGTPRAIEAAWKYVVLCSVGLALALATVILLYALGGAGGLGALNWTSLTAAAPHFPTGPIKLAYLFALVGFGTKAGLAPLHAWLPDAHSEAPAPVSALLSGVLLAVVLCTLVRVGDVTAAATGPAFPDHLLLGAGILSILVATPFLILQSDIKRLLAYSSIEQIGVMAVGFGLHAPLAALGAILQLVVHALTKSGLFFTAGRIVHDVGSQRLLRLRSLGVGTPVSGAALLFGVLTLGGLPPFGMFFPELAILRATFAQNTVLGLSFLFLLAMTFAGLFYHAGGTALGRSAHTSARRVPALDIAVLALPAALTIVIGLWTPAILARGLSAATALVLGGGAR